ncbi:MAG TPA: hypothetical protein VHP36_01660 [Chitinispirillaceae bacterium]|nr:hypothetical protein [Chitinispirillaceae bacterium]
MKSRFTLKTVISSAITMSVLSIAFAQNNAQVTDTAKAVVKKEVSKNAMTPQRACPVMGGKVDKSLFVDYEGKRIYVCCKQCQETFRKNPQAYIKKIEEAGQIADKIPQTIKKEVHKSNDSLVQQMDHNNQHKH